MKKNKTKQDKKLKVLMFGWEFPPHNNGGLGTACYGLTKALSNQNVEVTFVMPTMPDPEMHKFLKIISADSLKNVKIKQVDTIMKGYMTSEEYNQSLHEYIKYGKGNKKSIYGKNLLEEVERFAKVAALIARHEDFDVIHAHDWLTYKAGMIAKKVSGKPLVVHMHATEFDRTGGNGVNQYVYDIEREGMQAADAVITVSNFTKNMVTQHYAIDPNKITVVHNAVEFDNCDFGDCRISDKDKVVLFLGRITLQKGPDYFIEAAHKVSQKIPNVKFVVAGSGDMEYQMIERAAELGIGHKVLFAGFLRGKDIDRAYKMADLYVMPSVSEPFGITPLESMRNGTPVLISKQSGVSEVIQHCLKVDFWDVDEMTNKIVGVLKYKELQEELRDNGSKEVLKFSWNEPAKKCVDVYNDVLMRYVRS